MSRNGILWAAPLVLAAGVYAPALSGGLVWDDEAATVSSLAAYRSLRDVVFPPKGVFEWDLIHYRPFLAAVFLTEYNLFGRYQTFVPHAVNILSHVACTLLVWLIVRRLLRDHEYARWGAAFAACLFAVHPIHAEAVCWISGRSDTFAALFSLGMFAVILRLKDRRTLAGLIGAPVLFFLSLTCKEPAITAAAAAPLLVLAAPAAKRNGATRRTWAWLAAGMAAAACVYFALRHSAGLVSVPRSAYSPGETLTQLVQSFGYYLIKAVFPPPQTHYVIEDHLPPLGVSVALTAAAGLLCLLAARAWLRGQRVPGAAYVLFLASLAPAALTAVVTVGESPAAERYLYLPSVGLCLFAGWGTALLARHNGRRRAALWGVAGLVIVVSAAASLNRAVIWSDTARLWADAARKAPGQGLPLQELGKTYVERGLKEEALECFLAAARGDYDDEGRAIAHSNAGMSYAEMGKLDEAEQQFKLALGCRPQYANAHYGLGIVAMSRAARGESDREAIAHYAGASRAFKSALRARPHYGKALVGLARAEMRLGGAADRAGDPSAVGHYETCLRSLEVLSRVNPHLLRKYFSRRSVVGVQNRISELRAGP
jgi:tetratricopeptide (TPR) repeat protein